MAVEQHSDIYKTTDSTKTCARCHKRITDMVLVAMDKSWHVDHFTCAGCKQPIKESGFYVVDGRPYCAKDYKALYGKRCSACGHVIESTIYTALAKSWHPQCFVCKRCRKAIATKEFVEIRGLPYCIACSQK